MNQNPDSAVAVPSPAQHIAWVDYLRIAACFLVVLAHCCDPFVWVEDSSGVAWGSLVRCCVPLFVMITGVLLLPIKWEMTVFYSRRMKRILIPLVAWSLITPWIFYFYLQTNLGIESTNGMITEAAAAGQYTLNGTLAKMYLWLVNFHTDIIPLWYLYMLAGLYLFMPILNAWIVKATQKEMKIFIGLWMFSMCIPYVKMFAPMIGYQGNYGSMGVLGDCFWNPYGTFYYFAGVIGELVFARDQVKYPLNWSRCRTAVTAILMFAAGYAVTLIGFFEAQKKFPGQYEMLEIPWYFSGINVFMMTFAVFITFQKIKFTPSPFITRLAGLTFGVYLVHFFFVQFVYDWTHPLLASIPSYVLIPVNALISFAITLVIVWLISLNKWTRKSIM